MMGDFNTIEEICEDLRAGKCVVMQDDEDRENEGDVICAAEFATPENINFMATYAKGLICMPMHREYMYRLGIDMMVPENTDNHKTAFTESIDYKDTATGISAYERSVTAIKAVAEDAKPSDFRRPGHMFPLIAREGGIFERGGHTEATVDLMTIAGLKKAGLCCEIMADDGHMMRRNDLMKFAKKHGLKISTTGMLRRYRKQHEKLVECVSKAKLPTKYGDFMIYGYVNKLTMEHHVALVMGEIGDGKAVLGRVHSECLTGDVFGSARCDCGEQLDMALKMIAKEGRGVLLYLRQEGRGIGLINKIRAYNLQDQGYDTIEANVMLGFPPDMRDYTIGSQILQDLGVHELRLMTNNPKKIEGIEDFDLKIIERVPIQMKLRKTDAYYLLTKQDKMGHMLNYQIPEEKKEEIEKAVEEKKKVAREHFKLEEKQEEAREEKLIAEAKKSKKADAKKSDKKSDKKKKKNKNKK